MTLRDKANKLEEFLKENGINKLSIGIADKSPFNKTEKLYVYLVKKDYTTKKIPSIFMDVPVIVAVIGKIEIKT